jgi:hypothetical protein
MENAQSSIFYRQTALPYAILWPHCRSRHARNNYWTSRKIISTMMDGRAGADVGGVLVQEVSNPGVSRQLTPCSFNLRTFVILSLRHVVDAFAFGLSIGCLMMIVVVSMPRVATGDKYYEEGRFWLLLLVTWGLLLGAVTAGSMAFLMSGLSVLSAKWTVIGPLVPGMLLLLIGAYLMVSRLFWNLNPGPRAINTAWRRCFACCCCGPEMEAAEPDIEIRQQMSRDFWEQAALLVRGE